MPKYSVKMIAYSKDKNESKFRSFYTRTKGFTTMKALVDYISVIIEADNKAMDITKELYPDTDIKTHYSIEIRF